MNMITVSGPDGTAPHISHWADSGGVAVITWQGADGHTYQQEVGDEQRAINLVASIDADDQLVLISAQLRRRGTGPAG
jgi:hypothetical protein